MFRARTADALAVRLATSLAVLLGALVLVACGGDEDGDDDATTTTTAAAAATSTEAPTTAPPPTEQVTIALDWTANANFLGIYAAIDRGYFDEQGIEVKILPYAGTPAEPLIESGKADLAISYPPDVIINRTQGLEYRAVAALVAHNTTALAVLDSSDYARPADLDGTLYGGFGIQSDAALIAAILRADGVAKPAFKQVVLNTAVIDALAKDRVAYSAVFAGIDDVTAELQGTKLRLFPYRDYLGAAGDYPNAVFVASDATIEQRAEPLRRTLAALARGYELAAADPAEAGRMLIEQNESELSKATEIVERTSAATAPMFVGEDGRWGRLQDAGFAGLSEILVESGIVEEPPATADLYTNDLLPAG